MSEAKVLKEQWNGGEGPHEFDNQHCPGGQKIPDPDLVPQRINYSTEEEYNKALGKWLVK